MDYLLVEYWHLPNQEDHWPIAVIWQWDGPLVNELFYYPTDVDVDWDGTDIYMLKRT